MAGSNRERRQAFAAAARDEFEDLLERGVRVEGNVFSTVLFVKGELNDFERGGGALLGGQDGAALRAAALRLGYGPEDFCALSAVPAAGAPRADGRGSATLAAPLLREAIEAVDPETVMLLDGVAAALAREAYARALSLVPGRAAAALQPGAVVSVLGRRVLALGGFEAALACEADRQRMWARIKRLPPLGSPY